MDECVGECVCVCVEDWFYYDCGDFVVFVL